MTTYRAWNLKPLDRSALKELTAAIAQQSTEELENRAMETMDGEPWSEEKYQMTLAAQQKEAGLLAGILAARGITDPAEALTLLSGEEELTDPMLLTDMDKACARILDAIDREETIVVFGDYDVDGVTATALLYQHLKGMGANVKCMLPSREGDGYGLSKNAIQSIHDKGYQLIVTVDNGISALEEAEFAASLGVDLIVTDHHLPHDTLPKAVAVVDPRRADDTSPFKGLCGAGVAFKLCAALDGCPPEEMLDYCGDLAAVGTVADVMPLTGENRTLVKAGLHLLQHSDRPGLLALLDEVGLGGKPVTAENVSYAIAPRINAAGRMDSAVTALQLVLCEDEDLAQSAAAKTTAAKVHRRAVIAHSLLHAAVEPPANQEENRHGKNERDQVVGHQARVFIGNDRFQGRTGFKHAVGKTRIIRHAGRLVGDILVLALFGVINGVIVGIVFDLIDALLIERFDKRRVIGLRNLLRVTDVGEQNGREHEVDDEGDEHVEDHIPSTFVVIHLHLLELHLLGLIMLSRIPNPNGDKPTPGTKGQRWHHWKSARFKSIRATARARRRLRWGSRCAPRAMDLTCSCFSLPRSCTAPNMTQHLDWGYASYKPTAIRPKPVPHRSWSWRASRFAGSTC